MRFRRRHQPPEPLPPLAINVTPDAIDMGNEIAGIIEAHDDEIEAAAAAIYLAGLRRGVIEVIAAQVEHGVDVHVGELEITPP